MMPAIPPTQPVDGQPPSPMPRGLGRMFRARWVFLGLYIITIIAVYALFMGEGEFLNGHWTIQEVAIYTATVFGMQALLLAGAPQLRWPRPRHRRSIWVSLTAGALIAGLLTFGLLCTATSVLDLTNLVAASKWGNLFPDPRSLLLFLLSLWGIWLFVFGIMWVGEWIQVWRRMYRLLVAGSWLELLVTIPVDVLIRRRRNCYCDHGTFFAMVIGLTAILWTFGPGVVLLFLARRNQRRGYHGLCRRCGYDLRHAPAERCPECGAPSTR